MKSQEGQASDLSRLVDAIAEIKEVLAIILFGSTARREHDNHSDYDLLVIFKNKEAMWKQWDKLYEEVGKLNLLTHVIPKSLQELKENTEPTFLDSVLNEGKILYMKHPLETPAHQMGLKPMTIVSFSLSGLSQKEKMRALYHLYGRKNKTNKRTGIVDTTGSIKLAANTILVPTKHLQEVLDTLMEHGIKTTTHKLYAPQEWMPKLLPKNH